ncbi:fibroblast growth factor 19-like [Myxocyprinus asiaticus]|uniref:fibroblast growth factor 19-like n=1 Tax=Myxocyprinus asiaticus TaxID=70543 RepID=UPI0022227919|nr:fibroblast growth factor 19-like [Myxocyprinus asiaticus]
MLLLLLLTVWGSSIGVESSPLPESGPHLANDWGQVVRLRHLYAARHGLHLQINTDGKIGGSHLQSSHSLVEISPVDRGCVAIKAVATSRFLCMERNGKLYGSHIYTKEDCSFVERILPDGYNIYISDKHGALVNLGGAKSKLQNKDGTALSQFLPMVNTLSQEPTSDHTGKQHSPIDPEQDHQLGLQIDSMDPFGKISQIVIQSPSFNKR